MGVRAWPWGTKLAELGSSPMMKRDAEGNRVPVERAWHVALQANRESIRKHGIDHKIMGSGSLHLFEDNVDAYGFVPRKGNYVYLDRESAELDARPGVHDIWEVNIPESRRNAFHHDRGLPPGTSGQSPRKIPKRDLTLMPVEGPIAPEDQEKYGKRIEQAKRRLEHLSKDQFNA